MDDRKCDHKWRDTVANRVKGYSMCHDCVDYVKAITEECAAMHGPRPVPNQETIGALHLKVEMRDKHIEALEARLEKAFKEQESQRDLITKLQADNAEVS